MHTHEARARARDRPARATHVARARRARGLSHSARDHHLMLVGLDESLAQHLDFSEGSHNKRNVWGGRPVH